MLFSKPLAQGSLHRFAVQQIKVPVTEFELYRSRFPFSIKCR